MRGWGCGSRNEPLINKQTFTWIQQKRCAFWRGSSGLFKKYRIQAVPKTIHLLVAKLTSITFKNIVLHVTSNLSRREFNTPFKHTKSHCTSSLIIITLEAMHCTLYTASSSLLCNYNTHWSLSVRPNFNSDLNLVINDKW